MFGREKTMPFRECIHQAHLCPQALAIRRRLGHTSARFE
jgi:hypothetical protein